MNDSASGRGGGPLAVIDIGTNSVRLLVADVGDGRVVPRHQAVHQPRLGQGVHKNGRLDADAVQRTLVAIDDLVLQARRYEVRQISVVGTSALRDAADREQFIAAVHDCHGLDVTLLSGDEEAELSFYGAVRGALSPGASGRVHVLDVGGGSTEVVRGDCRGRMKSRVSADVGAVRMTELCIESDPPSPADRTRLVTQTHARLAPVLGQLAAAPEDGFGDTGVVVGVGGTVTTLAAIDLGLARYDANKIHGHRLQAHKIKSLAQRLARLTFAERAALPGAGGRADIIVAGSHIVDYVLGFLGGKSLLVSEHDLLSGIVLQRFGVQPFSIDDGSSGRL